MRRRTLLQAAVALPWLSPLAAAAARGPSRLVVVFANGGWDATLTIDPKLGNPNIEGPEVDQDPDDPDDVDEVQTFGELPVVVNPVKRPSVTRFFERWSGRVSILNGIDVGSIAHDPCRWRVLSGRVDGRGPDLVAAAGAHLGADLPLGSVDMSGLALAGPLAASMGRVGARSQLEILLDPDVSPTGPSGAPPFVPTPRERAAVQSFLDARAKTGRGRFGTGWAYDLLEEARRRVERLLGARQSLVRGLELGTAPSITTMIPTTLDLLRDGVCSAVLLDSGSTWDTHESNVNQHAHFEQLFADLDALVGGLEQEGLLDSTLVAVMSEMGRTPKRNAALGKDHWPHASALLLGGPVAGGRVLGGTDAYQESRPVDFRTGELAEGGRVVRYDNLVAGILRMLEVDAAEWLPGVEPYVGALS